MLRAILFVLILSSEPTTPADQPELTADTGNAAELPPEVHVQPAATQLDVVRFGISPFISRDVLIEAFEPIMVYLSQKCGRRFELVIPGSYREMLSLVAAGEVEFAYLPPASYVKARLHDRSLRALLTDVLHGMDFYSGYLIVLESSGIDSLQALRGKRIAFVDTESTSGYLMPMRFLVARGIQPARYFSEIVFTGEHDESLQRLIRHEVDAIAISSGVLANYRSQGKDLRDIRILSKTGVIPHDVICATRHVPAPLAEEVQELLLELNSRSAAGRAVLPKVPRLNGWRVADPSEYDAIEDLVRRGEEGGP